mgnify:CR=1 FL=1
MHYGKIIVIVFIIKLHFHAYIFAYIGIAREICFSVYLYLISSLTHSRFSQCCKSV